jgi:hypothetical protein
LGSTFDTEDGNLNVDAPEADWASVALCDPPPASQENCEVRKADALSGSGDNSFTQGTKEDTAEPVAETGSIPPNKSDLKNFGVFVEDGANGKFVHLFWTRVQDPNGTTNMDFEFNQGSDLAPNDVTPLRTGGDLLITYELSRGGTVPNLFLLEWVTEAGTGTGQGTCDASNAYPCWGNRVDLDAAGAAAGSINQTAIPAGDADGLGALSARTFGEATIDLDFIFDENKCTSFGSVYLKSRSSDSFTSALKDFIAPTPVNLTNCAKVIIRKSTDPSGGEDFSFTKTFTTDPATAGTFDLDDGQNATFNNVLLGSGLKVDETTLPTGWDFDSVDCDASTGVTPSFDGSEVTFTLDDTSDVLDCTYYNKARGSITIVKNTVGGNATFTFDGPAGLPSPADASGDFSLTTVSNTDSVTFSNLVPGSYSVSETVPSGWDLTNLTCSDAPDSTTTAAPVTAGNTATAVIDLDAGESITCTFTNTERGSIAVKKETIPDGSSATFDFSGNITATLSDGQTSTAVSVVPGQYSASEAVPTGWDMTDISCDDANSTDSSTDVAPGGTATATFNVEAGEDVVCTFTNTQRGSITVSKTDDAAPYNPLEGVTFNVYADDGDATFEPDPGDDTFVDSCTTDSSGECTVSDLVPGGYWVDEDESTLPAGHSPDPGGAQLVTVTASGQASLDFVNPRLHKIIVIVCHLGTNDLAPSDVELGAASLVTVGADDLTGTDFEELEGALCGLDGFTDADDDGTDDIGHGDQDLTVDVASKAAHGLIP